VSGAFVQAMSGLASAAIMATHYTRQNQLIPWAEQALFPHDAAVGSGGIASFSSSVLPRAGLHSCLFTQFLLGKKIVIFAKCCKLCGTMGGAEFLPSGRLRKTKGGDRGTHTSAPTIDVRRLVQRELNLRRDWPPLYDGGGVYLGLSVLEAVQKRPKKPFSYPKMEGKYHVKNVFGKDQQKI